MNETVFEVTQGADGGYCAECLTESIFTQGDTWDELRANVKQAVEAFYFDRTKPTVIRLAVPRGPSPLAASRVRPHLSETKQSKKMRTPAIRRGS